ncbi:MAG: cyclic nucleotide-binding domain-containing protein [Kiritimatiellaeota bacterium]|nr:cyclic nucleotide-binding domain-containing protein [Kiritimatiellota bacterium]
MDGRQLALRKARLSDDLEVGLLPDGTRLLKRVARATYLAVSPRDWEIFQQFDGEKSVRDVLETLLSETEGCNVREFYDLIVSALTKGILDDPVERTELPSVPEPTPWPAGWSDTVALCVSLVVIVFGAIALGSAPIQVPVSLAGWFFALVFIGLELSVASLLEGCVLAGCGRTVYDFGWRWDRIIPYVGIDARDAFMGGRKCEVAVALQALAAPYALALAARFARNPEGMLAAYVGVLALAAPFGGAPGARLLHALFRKAHDIPRCTTRFLKHRLFRQLLRWKTEVAEDTYITLFGAYAVFWLGLLLRFGAGLLRRQGGGLAERIAVGGTWAERVGAGAILLVLLLFVFVPVIVQLWIVVHNVFAWVAPRWFRAERRLWTKRSSAAPATEDVRQFLARTLLFSQLSDKDLAAIAERARFVRARDGEVLVRQGDRGDCLFVLLEGRATVHKEDEIGHSRLVAELQAGDVFGEVALLEKVPRTATVRARGAAALLMLNQEVFEELVLEHLGVQAVRRTVQISGALRRCPLFADWPDQTLLELAREVSLVDVAAGECVVRQGRPNKNFYLVYEGRFEVRKDSEVVAQLGPGEFFGEISLLEHRPATADVVAAQSSRCLCIGRKRFFELITGDAFAGYVVASAAEMREGR